MAKHNLKDLLQGVATFSGNDIQIERVVTDSRKIRPGDVFVAHAGVDVDAHQFIDQAVKSGAVAVVGEKDMSNVGVPYFKVLDGRVAWAKMMANFYDSPEKKLHIIGVTGTDGKTTTSTLVYQILKQAGLKVALVSTVAAYIGVDEFDTGFHVTSPDPDTLYPMLKKIVDAGCKWLVLETTSHALAMHRYGNIKFEIAVLTNITHEHLDFHKTFEQYREAKMKIFNGTKWAVLNTEEENTSFIQNKLGSDVKIKLYKPYIGKVSNALNTDYNRQNFAAAATVAELLNIDKKYIEEVAQSFSGITGRLEELHFGQKFRAIVDFAHTPNALEQVLKNLRRQVTKGHKIILVFGCAGLRDHTKRPMMGQIATRLADKVIVTAEDPRTEDLGDIYRDIAAPGSIREDDRQKAIDMACKTAKAGDIVVATGKGHEKSLAFGTSEYPWSDQEAFAKAIKKL